MKTWKPIVVSLAVLFASCGDDIPTRESKKAIVPAGSPYPTAENMESWMPLWEEGSWIVRVKPQTSSPQSLSKMRQQLTNHFLEELQTGLHSHSEAVLRPFLSKHLKMEFLVNSKDMRAHTNEEADILFVSFGGSPAFQNSLTRFSPLLNTAVFKERQNLLAKAQLEALQQLEGAHWVEPNLKSRVFQETGGLPPGFDPATKLPPEFASTDNREIMHLHRSIRADKAMQYAIEQGRSYRRVRVAVLDTGIDHLHPDLKSRMYVNPGEVPDDRIDNDGNGWIDDVHGVDATIEKGSFDDGPAPIPGSADIGGPGQPCPQDTPDDPWGLGTAPMRSSCGHGTHVAGIIAAAAGGESTKTVGVCPTCELISVRVASRVFDRDEDGNIITRPDGTPSDRTGEIEDAAQIRGLKYLLDLSHPQNPSIPVTDIVNMSYGKYFASRNIEFLIRSLQSREVIFVAAAGNDALDTRNYPAAYPGVVSVCATGTDTNNTSPRRAPFSNFGEWVKICAPGQDVWSTMPGGVDMTQIPSSTWIKKGTSQATPFVAGALGFLISSSERRLTPSQYVQRLLEGANYKALYSAAGNDLFGGRYDDGTHFFYLGAGVLDVDAAVRGVKQSPVGDLETYSAAVTSGCVAGNIGAQSTSYRFAFLTSAPFLLLQGFGMFFLFGRILRRMRKDSH